MNCVPHFSEITINDRSRIEGKGNALAQMHKEGMRIPEHIIAREYGLTCVTGIINLSSHLRWMAIVNREGFGTGIKDSPLVDRDSSYSFITSLNYKI